MLRTLDALEQVRDRVQLDAPAQAHVGGCDLKALQHLGASRIEAGSKRIVDDGLERAPRRSRDAGEVRRDVVVQGQGGSGRHIMKCRVDAS